MKLKQQLHWDGWVLGIVEDTIDKVDRNDPSSPDALRTG